MRQRRGSIAPSLAGPLPRSVLLCVVCVAPICLSNLPFSALQGGGPLRQSAALETMRRARAASVGPGRGAGGGGSCVLVYVSGCGHVYECSGVYVYAVHGYMYVALCTCMYMRVD